MSEEENAINEVSQKQVDFTALVNGYRDTALVEIRNEEKDNEQK
jgi:hypothetical protein